MPRMSVGLSVELKGREVILQGREFIFKAWKLYFKAGKLYFNAPLGALFYFKGVYSFHVIFAYVYAFKIQYISNIFHF